MRQSELLLPGCLLLFLRHVRVVVSVDLLHHLHSSDVDTRSGSTTVDLCNFRAVVIENGLAISSEDTLNAWHDGRRLNDADQKPFNIVLQRRVVWVVDHFPLVLSSVEYGLDREDRYDLLLISFYVVLEVE